MNIIHLEDDLQLRIMVKRWLKGLDELEDFSSFRLLQVADEEEFWELFYSSPQPPALVILDADIGGQIIGPRVLTALRQNEGYKGPVLALSSTLGAWELVQDQNFSHLAKPVSKNSFVMRILSLL